MAYGSGVQRPLSQAGLHLICNHHLATGGIKSKLVRERERGSGNAIGGAKLSYLPIIAGLFEELTRHGLYVVLT